jgi:hypothetical protein
MIDNLSACWLRTLLYERIDDLTARRKFAVEVKAESLIGDD